MLGLKTRSLTLIFLAAFMSISYAQQNITVKDTDPSIKYEGNAGDASLCKLDSDGNLAGGQPGCYLVYPNCTSSAAMGQGGSGAASMKFNGTAIYINSLLDDLSPIYTVTLDGQSTDVDGVRDSLPFFCYPLYSQSGLDPKVEHEIRLSVKGPSPTRNQTIPGSDDAFNFALINFIYTAVDSNGTSTSGSSTSSSTTGSTSSSGGTTTAASSTPSNAAVISSRCSVWLALGTVVALGCLVVL